MKTKFRRISKRTLAIVLSALILVTSIGIGSFITVNAGTATTVYYSVPAATVGSYTVKWNANYKGDGDDWHSGNMTDTGKLMNGNKVYSASFTDAYNGLGKLQFQLYDGSTWKSQQEPISSWTSVGNYNGKVFVHGNGSTWSTLSYDDYVVAGDIASNSWDNSADVMTYSSSTYTKTYSSKAAGNYTFAVVKKGAWSPSYRWAAKGTLTDNGCGSWADANDGDHNIKLTLTKTANVQITLNSSQQVDVTLTAVTHSVTRTAPSNGTLYVSTSSTVGTGTTATVAEGATYYIKATPSSGYKLTALTVTPSGGSAVSVIGSNSGATSAVTVSRTMGTADENVAATFAKRTYTVTYNKGTASGATGSEQTDTKTHGTALTLKGAIFTRTGYTQTGWNTNSSGSGGTHYDLSGSYTSNAAVTLYPEWTENTYTITYKDQGGSAFSGTHASGAPTSHTYGTATTLKSASKDGYTFGGWFTTSACTGTAVTSLGATAYTDNITLYAKWTIKTYTITYNKGANGTGSIASGTKTHGVDFTLSSSTFTRADYTQTGWATSDGGTKAYELGGTYTANSNITLYPFWTLTASPQLASISNVTGKTVNDTSFNVSATINNSQHASGTLSVTASSDSTSIITVGTVSKSGDNVTIPLTVKGPGTATITVTLKDGGTTVDTKLFTVTVDAPTFTITADTIYASTKNKALTVTKSPTPSSTTWASNKTTYVTVNSSGQVTAAAVPTSDQTATITATATYACGYSKSFTGTVTLKAPTLTISSTKTSGYINDTAIASVSSAANPSLTTNTLSAYNWTSSDSTVVSVSDATAASPTLTFLKNGTATISLEVTYKNTLLKKTSNSVTITVNAPTVTMANKTVAKGDSVTFSATTTNPSSGLNITYSLQSAVSGVSITSAGVVSVTSSCSANSATVVATVTNAAGATVATQTATLTIQAPSVTIADIANNSTQKLTVGTNITNKAVSNNFSGTYTVTSSKTSVATASITSGKLTVTSVAKGKTTITVTATKGSITASCTFTVLVAGPASTDHVIYFTDNVNWGSACIHAWGADGGAAIADRASMTKIGTNENSESVYAYKFTASDWANVQHIRFLKNSSANWDDGTQTFTDFSYSGFYKNGSYDISVTIPQISADDIADLPITTSTSLYADVLNSTTPSKFTWSIEDTSIATIANADTGTTNYNSVTGVYPGTTTVTIKAYAELPTDWTPITDGTADAFLADSTTASVTVTATPKTVTWGTKVSTDNGSTYSTNSSAGTVTVTNGPSSSGGTVAHGTQVTFSASTNSGYKFAGWQVDGNNTITTTTSKTVTVNANTTVYALYYKTYTVTLTAGTGFTSSGKKYRIGSSGSYSTYSSALTVNQGAVVYFQVAYSTGYEYNGVTNATVVTANTVFKTAAISGDLTVTITAKRKTYPLTGVVSPAHGTVTFYSNSTCTTSINSATYNTAFYAKYTPADGYSLNSFTTSDANISATSGNVATCKVTSTYANKTSVTITANVALEHTVTYYVDMHSDSVVNTIALYSNSNASTALQYNNNGTLTNCSATPTKQGSSTVYAADIKTPLTSSGVGFSPIYVKITYTLEGASSSEYKIVTLSSANLGSINNSADKSVWLEAASDSPQDLSISYATNSTSTVASGYQRIYLKKPYSWQNTTEGQKWTNIGVYYWGDNPTDIGWTNSIKMKYLGYDSNGSDGYHYYYADIPIKITDGGTDYTVKNIIFQGWGTNTSLGGDSNKILAKTDNIMNFTKNYFKLDNSNNEIQGVPELSSAMVPAYTRYASGVTVQKGENQTINIKPTTSNTVTFSSGTPSVATVSASGVVTPVKKGSTTITVTVYGTVGYLVRNNEQTDLDRRRYTLTVTVKDPSVVSGFNIMSLATATKTITIPTVSGSQPGYFDSAPTVTVTGTPSAPSAGYTSSAIVTATETTSVSGVGTKPITYTVKYAAPNNTFTGYSGITVTATEIVSMSIRFNDANRYGYKHWTVDGVQDTAIIATKKVEGGIETATTKDVTLDGTTYNEVFEAYTYVDVTFNFDYYEYETERTVQKLDDDGNPIPLKDGSGNIIEGQFETEQKQFYQYDKSWIGNNDNRAQADAEKASGLIHYDHKTYTVTDFEVRGFNSGGVTAASIYEYAQAAIGNKPNNNYYNYTIDESTIKSISKPNTYKATVKVEMTHTPKTYKVYIGTSRQQGGSGANGNYYYQEYANLSTGTSYNWILTDSTGNLNGPTLFTGKTYKFRVTGDTYLKRTTGTIADDDFNRSRVALTNQGVSYEPKSTSDPTIVEKLTNDFYIADFFDPAKVLNDRGLQEDDVKFVGGGVLYYQVKDGVPAQKAVDGGYVDSSTGAADSEAVSEFIKEKIEAGLENPSIVPADIEGTDDRMAVAYGTKINAQKDSNTDLFIRYLPNEVFRRTSGGALETETVEGVTSYTMATDRSADAYRYSNSLKAYQYIYASTMENRAANYGKNMLLYAYYIYSYTAYDEDTGIPETVYNVVLSDQPANATTYFNANN